MAWPDRDFWIGVFMVGLATILWLEAGKIQISPLDGPVNAAGMPKSLAWALGILAPILMARSLFSLALWRGHRDPGLRAWLQVLDLRPHACAGGMIGLICLVLLTKRLASVALFFTPPAYFSLGILGLSVIASLSSESLIKGLMAGIIGLMIATFGSGTLHLWSTGIAWQHPFHFGHGWGLRGVRASGSGRQVGTRQAPQAADENKAAELGHASPAEEAAAHRFRQRSACLLRLRFLS